jgi:CHAT domain-containing protein
MSVRLPELHSCGSFRPSNRIRYRKLWTVFVTMLMTSLCSPAIAAGTSDLQTQLKAATAQYYQGDILSSIAALRALADQQLAGEATLTGKTVLEYLLDVCVGAWDAECVREYAGKYSHLVESLKNVADPLKLPFAMQTVTYASYQAWLTSDHSLAKQILANWPDTVEVPWVPRDYIRRQLIRARLNFMEERRDAARLCVDRALMSIAAIDNGASSLMELTTWLSEAVEDLLELGDNERAVGLVFANRAVGQKIFPTASIEYYRLLRVATEAYSAAGMVPQALSNSRAALSVLSHLHLPAAISFYHSSDISATTALLCAAANDIECARRALDAHPLHAALDSIRTRGTLQNISEVSYLATRALVDVAPEGQGVEQDAALLSLPFQPNASLPKELLETVSLYQRLGHAISEARKDPVSAASELRDLAPDLLRVESFRTSSLGLLPKRSLIEQIALGVTLGAFRGTLPDHKAGDAVVGLVDLESRNGQSFSSDALSLLASAADDEVRTDVGDLLRLRSRRDASERADIARMLSTVPKSDPSGAVVQPVFNFSRRQIYSDYDSRIDSLMARIQTSQPTVSAALRPATLGALQGSIREHEAVISSLPLLGGTMGHLCVTRDTVDFDTTQEDGPALQRDVRLLSDALASTNPPDEELDRQYPVNAARHIFNAYVLPARGCASTGDSLIIAGSAPDTIPFAALLTEGTQKELDGKPLAQWPWLIKTFSVSRLSTLSAIVALRASPVKQLADHNALFLGIADPAFIHGLGRYANDSKLAMRGAVGITSFSALPPLPDARSEVEGVGTLFRSDATLLIGDSASEGSFRRLPLEQYTYIEFATHGLVRQDMAGLTEAALAMSPGTDPGTDTFDDGLLTASEIADLPLRARFVALSACNTGVVDYNKFSSEVPSLANAFQVAGVPAILATLWPVDSGVSKSIVSSTFEKLLRDSVGPSKALAESQVNYLGATPRTAYQHPRFWAPFVILGDGSTPSKEVPLNAGRRIDDIRLLTKSGGFINSAVRLPSAEIIVHGMGDVREGIRHSSVTTMYTAALSANWTFEDTKVAQSPILLPLGGMLLLGGYRGGGETPTIATLQLLTDKGSFLQEWTFAQPDLDTMAAAATPLSANAALVAVVQHARQATAAKVWPPDHVVLFEVSPGHPPIVKGDLELKTSSNPTYLGIKPLGNSFLLMEGEAYASTLPKPYFNRYHQLGPCSPGAHTELFLIDHNMKHVTWTSTLDEIAVTASLEDGNGVLLAGTQSAGCGEGGRVSLWHISKDLTKKQLYEDAGTRPTEARALYARSDGGLLLLGGTQRETDVATLEERDPNYFINNSGKPLRVSFSTRQISDGIVISLDRSFKEQSRSSLRAATDLWLAGAFQAANHLWFYGSLGNQAAIFHAEGF